MFETFSKKMTAVFKKFDEGFVSMDEAFAELDKELDLEVKAAIEKETVVEETRPDGTKVVTRTIIRKTESSPKK